MKKLFAMVVTIIVILGLVSCLAEDDSIVVYSGNYIVGKDIAPGSYNVELNDLDEGASDKRNYSGMTLFKDMDDYLMVIDDIQKYHPRNEYVEPNKITHVSLIDGMVMDVSLDKCGSMIFTKID